MASQYQSNLIISELTVEQLADIVAERIIKALKPEPPKEPLLTAHQIQVRLLWGEVKFKNIKRELGIEPVSKDGNRHLFKLSQFIGDHLFQHQVVKYE